MQFFELIDRVVAIGGPRNCFRFHTTAISLEDLSPGKSFLVYQSWEELSEGHFFSVAIADAETACVFDDAHTHAAQMTVPNVQQVLCTRSNLTWFELVQVEAATQGQPWSAPRLPRHKLVAIRLGAP